MLQTSVDRWEKRDAAFCLLALELPPSALPAGVSKQMLEDHRWCSQKWLDMKVRCRGRRGGQKGSPTASGVEKGSRMLGKKIGGQRGRMLENDSSVVPKQQQPFYEP